VGRPATNAGAAKATVTDLLALQRHNGIDEGRILVP
jgi:hypothetical protein